MHNFGIQMAAIIFLFIIGTIYDQYQIAWIAMGQQQIENNSLIANASEIMKVT